MELYISYLKIISDLRRDFAFHSDYTYFNYMSSYAAGTAFARRHNCILWTFAIVLYHTLKISGIYCRVI